MHAERGTWRRLGRATDLGQSVRWLRAAGKALASRNSASTFRGRQSKHRLQCAPRVAADRVASPGCRQPESVTCGKRAAVRACLSPCRQFTACQAPILVRWKHMSFNILQPGQLGVPLCLLTIVPLLLHAVRTQVGHSCDVALTIWRAS